MTDTYKIKTNNIEDSIEAYRQYYFFEKSHMFNWKKRDIPEWIIEYQNLFE